MLNIIMTKNKLMTKTDHNIGDKNNLTWLLLSLGTVVIISFVLPFPISFVVSLLVIICLNFIRLEMTLRKAGVGGIKGLFKSSGFGAGSSIGTSTLYQPPLRFSCMNCGNEHSKIACPRCGSKAVRAA